MKIVLTTVFQPIYPLELGTFPSVLGTEEQISTIMEEIPLGLAVMGAMALDIGGIETMFLSGGRLKIFLIFPKTSHIQLLTF